MYLDLDVRTVPVAVLGVPGEAAAAVRRWSRAGARVTAVEADLCSEDDAGLGSARVVVVVGRAQGWRLAARLEGGPHLRVDEPADPRPRGRVVLVGAGPGGAGLLTVAARGALADADVVLTDRLAEVGSVAALAPGAQVVDVGKQPGHHAVGQDAINALLVEHARAGRTVVRLKGGDPFVFGRGGEEVAAAVEAGLPVQVVPGVTSAIAVPGAAGIPVTHRHISRMVTIVSGHLPLSREQAEALATLGGTLVLLMGVNNLVPITELLLAAGMPADTEAAVVERGFSPTQRTTLATLGTVVARAHEVGVRNPAVIVVGEVVAQAAVWRAAVDAAH